MRTIVGTEQSRVQFSVSKQAIEKTWTTLAEVEQRRAFLRQAGVITMEGRVSLVSRSTYSKQKHQRIPYAGLVVMAEKSIRSHRLEQQVVAALRSLGITADVMPVTVDGDTSRKAADVIITAANGQKFTLEVKQNRSNNKRYNLGLPVNPADFGGLIDGYRSYPDSLLVDSCAAWEGKLQAAEDAGNPLIGCVIACNIGKLSTENDSCLGLVLVPTDSMADWEETWVNYRHGYYAYSAPNSCLYNLSAISDVMSLAG
jgi:hypothetical protein